MICIECGMEYKKYSNKWFKNLCKDCKDKKYSKVCDFCYVSFIPEKITTKYCDLHIKKKDRQYKKCTNCNNIFHSTKQNKHICIECQKLKQSKQRKSDVCIKCGQLFIKTSPNKIQCDTCRTTKIYFSCPTCGKKHNKPNCRCSECVSKEKLEYEQSKLNTKHNCAVCDIEFTGYTRTKFCSTECYKLSHKSPRILKPKIIFTHINCLYCGKLFKTSTNKPFCSKNCKREYTLTSHIKYDNIYEIYDIIKADYLSYSQTSPKTWFRRKGWSDVFNSIISLYPNFDVMRIFDKNKIIYDFFNGSVKCLHCNNESTFMNLRVGYSSHCSKKCSYKSNSINRMGLLNPVHKRTIETKNRLSHNQSIFMKQNIASGKFTPCVTNSWANSRIKLSIDNCDFEFRSTWECFFWLLNKHTQYEKLRVPYYDTVKLKKRNYIIDFIDEQKRILYEVKPNCNKTNQNVIDKEQGAMIWCKENDYTYEYITEDYFMEHIDDLTAMQSVIFHDKLYISLEKMKNVKNKIY